MDVSTVLLLVAGLVLLTFGAQQLVDGAAALAVGVGISPLVVGLTVVAFGTSSPELAAGLGAALRGQPDIAVGNVVGSNIFNVLLILGAAAIIVPLPVSAQLVRLEVPLMIGVSVLTFLLALDGAIGRLEGALLFAGAVAYTTLAVRRSRRESAEVQAEFERGFGRKPRGRRVALEIGRSLAGLLMLLIGARWLVDGAVEVARALGVDELVIGLTVVAGGTSLPEAATSVVAAVRGEPDIAVGNAIGSNLFNLLLVLGATALATPGGLGVAPAALRFDMPVMIAVAVACLPIFFTGRLVARWEGALFLAYFSAHVLYLFLQAAEHAVLPVFSAAMLAFALPLTVLTLAFLGLRALVRERG